MSSNKIVITGAAGLVGQNLVSRLKAQGSAKIVAIDKHPANTATLRKLHPELRIIEADLAEPGPWQQELEGCTHLVIGHAQIGGLHPEEFVRNNIQATERLLDAALRYKVSYAVSISSSVVNSLAVDDYTETKKAQEALQRRLRHQAGRPAAQPLNRSGCVAQPPIASSPRFMQKTPVFPIPGDGRYLRQPLFAGDFCSIIASALQTEITGAYNITGQERIDYIDLIRLLKEATGARTRIQKIPYGLFSLLLKANALVDKNPAFTAKQLEALVTPDVFEVIDWPGIFGVDSTPLKQAFEITFQDPVYSKVALDF